MIKKLYYKLLIQILIIYLKYLINRKKYHCLHPSDFKYTKTSKYVYFLYRQYYITDLIRYYELLIQKPIIYSTTIID